TAETFTLQFEMRAPGNPAPLWRPGPTVQSNLPVGGLCQVECRIPCGVFSAGLESPYTLEVRVRLAQDDQASDEPPEPFPLEIDRGGGFERNDIPWDEVGVPDEHLFKGRTGDLDELESHIRSGERNKTPLLVGLTRTGKSSLLKFLARRLHLQP